MNKVVLFLLLILLSFNSYSEGFVTAKNIKVDLSGFVRNDFIYDSRRNLDACDHLLELYPLAPVYDTNGADINAKSSAQFLNTFSRIGTNFSGLEMGKTKINCLTWFKLLIQIFNIKINIIEIDLLFGLIA